MRDMLTLTGRSGRFTPCATRCVSVPCPARSAGVLSALAAQLYGFIVLTQ